MDSAALLDILGNENRRRILRLLSRKPCYVTEISEQLGVSPKAVIDHLRTLEEAGLIESHTDQGRRKYFHIAEELRLEVTVSPYGFGTKSAYPASASLDVTACRHLSIEADPPTEQSIDSADLADAFRRFEELEHELSLAQRWVHGRLSDVHDRIAETVNGEIDEQFAVILLRALLNGPATTETLAHRIDAPPAIVQEALTTLADGGLVRYDGDLWELND